jgi:hypothetical protein
MARPQVQKFPRKTEPCNAIEVDSTLLVLNKIWTSAFPGHHVEWPRHLSFSRYVGHLETPVQLDQVFKLWPISGAVSSTCFPRQGSTLMDSLPHLSSLKEYFISHFEDEASPHTVNMPLLIYLWGISWLMSILISHSSCLHESRLVYTADTLQFPNSLSWNYTHSLERRVRIRHTPLRRNSRLETRLVNLYI